jgi:thiamine biosynthesis protein ThiS
MDASVKIFSLTINGEQRGFPAPLSVAELVAVLELDIRKVAVELNREIVPRSTYEAVRLRSGDQLEIVHFIGGG